MQAPAGLFAQLFGLALSAAEARNGLGAASGAEYEIASEPRQAFQNFERKPRQRDLVAGRRCALRPWALRIHEDR